jgi:glutamine synthetase
MEKITLEYIWLGGVGEVRSKTRVVEAFRGITLPEIPTWNYDGSSTGQASSDGNTEIVLRPAAVYKDPFRIGGFLVLCDIEDINGSPIGHRYYANQLFNQKTEEKPWFGLEQEYFILHAKEDLSHEQGTHYCGVGICERYDRQIVEKHLNYCIAANLNISGMNAEVASHQWEFQIGPCVGIDAADQLYVARYILQRIADDYECEIVYKPKLLTMINGSGCHVNFSTESTRGENGVEVILNEYIPRLGMHHAEDVRLMGNGNEERLTGLHETSSMEKFTYGIGTRNTSIRVGNDTFNKGKGYFEDRRPAANIEPYTVTSLLFMRCCLE